MYSLHVHCSAQVSCPNAARKRENANRTPTRKPLTERGSRAAPRRRGESSGRDVDWNTGPHEPRAK